MEQEHSLCEYYQCFECRDIPMPLRRAVAEILKYTKPKCLHEQGFIQKMAGSKVISKICIQCSANI